MPSPTAKDKVADIREKLRQSQEQRINEAINSRTGQLSHKKISIKPKKDQEQALSAAGGGQGGKEGTDVEFATCDTDAKKEDDTIIIRTKEAKPKAAEDKLFEIQNLNNVPSSLGKLSLAAMVFQFGQGIILFYLASKSKYYTGLYTNYPSKNGLLFPETKVVGVYSLLWLAPSFIFMSGAEHMACIVFRESYTYYIARHQNPFRWTEYTFSASTMRVMIAQLVGITDIQCLVMMFVLTASSIQCPATHEAINAKARADNRPQYWRPFLNGWLGHMTSWVVIFTYFHSLVLNGLEAPVTWAVVVILFLLDLTFPICFTLQWLRIYPFDDYVVGEKGFILLSFTAKALLAWLIFGITSVKQY